MTVTDWRKLSAWLALLDLFLHYFSYLVKVFLLSQAGKYLGAMTGADWTEDTTASFLDGFAGFCFSRHLLTKNYRVN
jgi:uncharacterized membrane protein